MRLLAAMLCVVALGCESDKGRGVDASGDSGAPSTAGIGHYPLTPPCLAGSIDVEGQCNTCTGMPLQYWDENCACDKAMTGYYPDAERPGGCGRCATETPAGRKLSGRLVEDVTAPASGCDPKCGSGFSCISYTTYPDWEAECSHQFCLLPQ